MVVKDHYKLIKLFCLILIIGFFQSSVRAQSLLNQHYLSNDVENLINTNPDQALKIAQHLLSKTNITYAEKAKVNFLISKAYRVKGDYSSALNFLFEEKNYTEYLSDKEKIAIEIQKIIILRELSLDKQAKIILKNAENSIDKISDSKAKLYLRIFIAQEKAEFFLREDKVDKGIDLLGNDRLFSNGLLNDFDELKLYYNIVLGKLYLEKRKLDEAKKHFEIANNISNTRKSNNVYANIDALTGLANVCFLKKEHNNVIHILDRALLNSQQLGNVFLQEKIISQQNVNYLALNDTTDYKLTNASFIKIQFQSEQLEQEAVNTAYNLFSDEYTDRYSEQKNYYLKILFYAIGLFLFIVVVCAFFLLNYVQRVRNLNEIINYIKITRSNLVSSFTERKSEPKKNIILKETEEQILNKLKKFENSKRFLNKDISLAVLAGQLDSNTKYLSEIINSHYNVNFNTYINKLRINYIIEKLKTDPNFINYKISYLADNCGFSSHSSFATVFKSITGISPVKFIELLNDEKENTLLK